MEEKTEESPWKEFDEMKELRESEKNLPLPMKALREAGFFTLQLFLALIVCMMIYTPMKPSKFGELPAYFVSVLKSVPNFGRNFAGLFKSGAVSQQNTIGCLLLSSVFYSALALMTSNRLACAIAAPMILFDYSFVAFATKEFQRTVVFLALGSLIPISFKLDVYPLMSTEFIAWLSAAVLIVSASLFGDILSAMPVCFLTMGLIRCAMWINPRYVTPQMQKVNAGLIWGAQYLAAIAIVGILGGLFDKTGLAEKSELFSIRERAAKLFEAAAGDNLIMFLVLAFLALMVPDAAEDGRLYVMLISTIVTLRVSAFTSSKATLKKEEIVESKFCEVKEILFLTFCLRICSIPVQWFSLSFLLVAGVFALLGFLNLI